MSTRKRLIIGLCRLCRLVSFGLNDTRHKSVSFVSTPFRGDTNDTRPEKHREQMPRPASVASCTLKNSIRSERNQ